MHLYNKVYIDHISESVLLNKIGRKSNTNETNECCFINNLIFGTWSDIHVKRGIHRETQLLCQSR